MTFLIRAATADDLQHLYEMAKRTGGGFTNLPPDRKALIAKLERGAAAFARTEDEVGDDLFVFVLENTATGEVRGTCQIFSAVGLKWPFYSYRIGALTQHSEELGRTFRADILNLSTDLEGASEVGGLFLHPGERAGGLGMLIARSRYLFIRNHRARFADRTLAELRGVIDEAGGSPFWDGVAGRFFGMNFQDADEFNAKHGNQFIADLMPKHPVYIAMLPETARSAIGLPHPSGRAAMDIKLADNTHNMDPERIAKLPEADRGIARRYGRPVPLAIMTSSATDADTRAWLADHPADEGDDASPEWLCGIGAFHRPMQPAGSHMVSTREAVEQDDGTVLPVVAIQFPPPPRGHRVPVWVVWVYGHPRCLNECPTRQYVRRLCQALNIPLAEGR